MYNIVYSVYYTHHIPHHIQRLWKEQLHTEEPVHWRLSQHFWRQIFAFCGVLGAPQLMPSAVPLWRIARWKVPSARGERSWGKYWKVKSEVSSSQLTQLESGN